MDSHDTGTLFRIVDAARQAQPADPVDVLAALALVVELRAEVDRAEQDLIGLARAHGASWREVAASLGLGSRQAAEQRWLRGDASAGRGRRQRLIDVNPPATLTRTRAAALLRTLPRRPDRSLSTARVELARQTLAIAVAAPPGALYDLVRLAIEDLSQVPERELGPAATASLRRLAAAVRADRVQPEPIRLKKC